MYLGKTRCNYAFKLKGFLSSNHRIVSSLYGRLKKALNWNEEDKVEKDFHSSLLLHSFIEQSHDDRS